MLINLPLFVVVMCYFRSVGIIGTVFDIIQNNLCEFVIFRGLKGFIVDFGQNLLFCVTDDKKDCDNIYETSILD